MKIKHLDQSRETLVNVNPGDVVLYVGKYYLCADSCRAAETMLVDIESGKVLYIYNAVNVKVYVCKGATMNPWCGYDAEESEC